MHSLKLVPEHPRFLRPGIARKSSALAIYINGESLIDRVRRCELKHARTEGAPGLAGNYVWPELNFRLAWLLTGGLCAVRTESVVLNCECGFADCWPLTMKVRSNRGFVTWHSFTQLRRDKSWNYGTMGELRFERASYFAELHKLGISLGPSSFVMTHAQPDHDRHLLHLETECTATNPALEVS